MSWADLSTSKLIFVARSQKAHILRTLEGDPAKFGVTPPHSESPPLATAFIAINVLSRVESELRNRGIDPATDKRLGKDVLGMIVEVKAEMLSNGIPTAF
jgi:hypothetical protein